MWMFVFAAILLLIAAGVISVPLMARRIEPYDLPDLPDESFRERDALLEAMSDLEASFHQGKLSEDDYMAQKRRLQLQYIEVVGEGALEG